MSCSGCRVLRKGCSESCILRPCLEWIETPEAQAHATVFLAKFFGRAALMSFLSNVPSQHRPPLFQSLLYEACGRTVNPVTGAVGLHWTGNWHVCQAAVDTVLRGGALRPIPDLLAGPPPIPPTTTTTTTDTGDASEVVCSQHYNNKRIPTTNSLLPRLTDNGKRRRCEDEKSAATISFESGGGGGGGGGGGFGCCNIDRPIQVNSRAEIRLLNLFV